MGGEGTNRALGGRIALEAGVFSVSVRVCMGRVWPQQRRRGKGLVSGGWLASPRHAGFSPSQVQRVFSLPANPSIVPYNNKKLYLM